MENYELGILGKGFDWFLILFLLVVIPLGFIGFMVALVICCVKKNLIASCSDIIPPLLVIMILELYVWKIYNHFPHTISVGGDEEYVYLKKILGKPLAIPFKDIQNIESRFWFYLIYYPSFMGYKRVNMREGSVQGYFIISPFFKKRKELLRSLGKKLGDGS